MFEKNGHDPSCNYAVDVVSYLYNEIGGAEKREFESHLTGCNTCSAELASFSGVRSSVNNWRSLAFDPLATPVIDIPFETQIEPAPVVAGWRGTILTDFKRLFAFSPWPPAAVGFAALAIFIGLGFFAFSYFNKTGNDLARNKAVDRPAVSPTVESVKGPGEVAINNSNTQPKGDDTGSSSVKPAEPEGTAIKVAATQSTPKNKPVKTGPDAASPKKPGDKPSTQQNQKAPNLNNYTEEEDKTLRLADLFEEIDTKE
jgi:hypothetical protein